MDAGDRESGAGHRRRAKWRPATPTGASPARLARVAVSTNFDGYGTSVRVPRIDTQLPPWGLRTTARSAYATGHPVSGRRRRVSHERRAGAGYRPRVVLIGLTGGIGSGKSTVSALLAERGRARSSMPMPSPGSSSSPAPPVFAAMGSGSAPAIVAADGIARPAGGRRHRVHRRRRRSRTSAPSCTRPSAWRSPRRLEAAAGHRRGRGPRRARCSWSRAATTWPRSWWWTSTRRWPSSVS